MCIRDRAIGNKGQNAKLAARLTGYKIDIKPESGALDEPAEPKADPASEAAVEETVETVEE